MKYEFCKVFGIDMSSLRTFYLRLITTMVSSLPAHYEIVSQGTPRAAFFDNGRYLTENLLILEPNS